MSAKKQTPLMRQYNQVKEQHQETILLFPGWGLHRAFGLGTELVSKELGIALNFDNNGGDQRTP